MVATEESPESNLLARARLGHQCFTPGLTPFPPRELKQTIMVVVHGKKCEVGKGKRDLREIRDLAEARGVQLVEVRTEREGHCEELVRDANFDNIDAVGVMGGDGTFREGVCGMIARGGGGDDGEAGSSCLAFFWVSAP